LVACVAFATAVACQFVVSVHTQMRVPAKALQRPLLVRRNNAKHEESYQWQNNQAKAVFVVASAKISLAALPM
jgi:hypothetical protein